MLRSEGGTGVLSGTAKAKPVARPLKVRVLPQDHDADLLERSRLERGEHVLWIGVDVIMLGSVVGDEPLQVRPIRLGRLLAQNLCLVPTRVNALICRRGFTTLKTASWGPLIPSVAAPCLPLLDGPLEGALRGARRSVREPDS